MRLPLDKQMSNQEISEVFGFVSQALGMDKKNFYRVRAYQEAGVVIKQLDYELKDKFRQSEAKFVKEVDALPGIGEGMVNKLVELFKTGEIKAFQKYVKALPAGIYPLVKLYGIGVKKAVKLARRFDLTSEKTAVKKLLAKAKQGKIRGLEGFGEKSESELVKLLEQQHKKRRIPYQEAVEAAERIKAGLERIATVSRVIFLGSLRRKLSSVGDIDLGIVAGDIQQVKKGLKGLKLVKRVLVSGEKMIRLVLTNGWQVDIKVSSLDEWGSFVQHFTGSKEHNIKLREIAMKKGLSLSEHGIKDRKTGRMKKFRSEKQFYNFLGFRLIPPEERVGGEELEKYAKA